MMNDEHRIMNDEVYEGVSTRTRNNSVPVLISSFGVHYSAFIILFLSLILCPAQVKPNVIIVMTDDQGYGDIAAHGNTIIQTPNMDALHSQSLRLTNFHVDATCAPTRAALNTGIWAMRAQVWHTISARGMLRGEKYTIAEMFKDNGYTTSMFGKWHLGSAYPMRAHDQGYDYALTHWGGIVGDAPDYWGNDYFDDSYFENGVPKKFTGYCTDIWFDEAIKWIDDNKSQPFFAYIATNAPHLPYRVMQEYIDMYADADWDGRHQNEIENFYGMITRIDEKLGDLMDYLASNNLVDNTILIFMTDNGTVKSWFNAGMRGQKGSMYDGGHRVPFFIRWPGGDITHGTDLNILAAHVDVIPTLAGLAGLGLPDSVQFDGIDLSTWLNGGFMAFPDRKLFVEQQRILHPEKYRNFVVMDQQYRWVQNSALYDMLANPGQQTDVQNSLPAVTNDFKQAYEDYWTEMLPYHEGYPEYILGSDHQNPTMLSGEDWMVDDNQDINQIPWHQNNMIRDDHWTGWYPVKVIQDGDYRFGLSRWPIEAIENDNRINRGITEVRLKIADVDTTVPVSGDVGIINIEVKGLKAGSFRLDAWLHDDQTSFFVYVERLTPNTLVENPRSIQRSNYSFKGNLLKFTSEKIHRFSLLDLQGRTVLSRHRGDAGEYRFAEPGLKGVYLLQLWEHKKRYAQIILIE